MRIVGSVKKRNHHNNAVTEWSHVRGAQVAQWVQRLPTRIYFLLTESRPMQVLMTDSYKSSLDVYVHVQVPNHNR